MHSRAAHCKQSADSEAARQLESAEFISGPISTEEQQMAAALDDNRWVGASCVCWPLGGCLRGLEVSRQQPVGGSCVLAVGRLLEGCQVAGTPGPLKPGSQDVGQQEVWKSVVWQQACDSCGVGEGRAHG